MSCPYATKLEEDSTTLPSSAASTTSSHKSSDLSAAQALQIAKASCPAFSSSCPFANVSDAHEMRQALSALPPSHISIVTETRNDTEGEHAAAAPEVDTIRKSLRVALEHVHSVSQSLPNAGEKKYELEGGCPLKTFKNHKGEEVTFVQAMEDFSLATIMANLLVSSEKDHEDVPNATVATPSTTPPPSPPASPRPSIGSKQTSVSHALQQGTAESHLAAESVHFVQEFIQGNIDRDVYARLVLNLHHLYQHLEQALDQVAPQAFPTVHFPTQLNRTEALAEDVEFFHGLDWELKHPLTSVATQEYINRIQTISQTEPLLVLAHAYTRYLGDLSGGKVLARVAKRALRLQGTSRDGLQFYHFESIPSAKLFKDDYRRALDELQLSQEQVERLVAEANVAFVMNMRIFEELDVLAGIPGASVRPLEEATCFYEECVKEQEERRLGIYREKEVKEGEVKCPFAALGGVNPHGNKTPTSKNTMTEISTAKEPSKKSAHEGSRCPWPFVFAHDPKQGMQDYQTWVVIALTTCWIWSKTPNM